MQTEKEIIDQICLLDDWFSKNGYRGYDIYDLYDVPLFHWLITNRPLLVRKINRKLVSSLVHSFPNVIIKTFGINRNVNAKAMGLILKGYCNLFRITREDGFRKKAVHVAEWLMGHRSDGITGYGWGYPFDWSGSKFIPKFTPSSVVTSIVGDGFYSLYKLTADHEYLNVCDRICQFYLNDLNIDVVDENRICFSYTPIDNDHVHNANLFASEFLIRVGKEIGNEEYVQYGIRGVNHTLAEQNDDGSIFYWGKKDGRFLKFTRSRVDHYHTGFELRKLWEIWKLLRDPRIKDSFDRYYRFYQTNFLGDGLIYQRPKAKNALNIHSCAEFIICNSIVKNGENTSAPWFGKILDWINREMLDTDRLYNFQLSYI